MSDEQSSDNPEPQSERASSEDEGVTPVDPNKLTPEEQMALYEKQMKEDDWGHQPC